MRSYRSRLCARVCLCVSELQETREQAFVHLEVVLHSWFKFAYVWVFCARWGNRPHQKLNSESSIVMRFFFLFVLQSPTLIQPFMEKQTDVFEALAPAAQQNFGDEHPEWGEPSALSQTHLSVLSADEHQRAQLHRAIPYFCLRGRQQPCSTATHWRGTIQAPRHLPVYPSPPPSSALPPSALKSDSPYHIHSESVWHFPHIWWFLFRFKCLLVVLKHV